ncbi:hypothetical protein ACIRQP_39610 [Streptomyces sp. NPDC102274]|uniref:hypothetical protein n=1 Tax=Streptomyces sp. NPDC102274 TaxID=3366151 RepID=UPI0037F37142
MDVMGVVTAAVALAAGYLLGRLPLVASGRPSGRTDRSSTDLHHHRTPQLRADILVADAGGDPGQRGLRGAAAA